MIGYGPGTIPTEETTTNTGEVMKNREVSFTLKSGDVFGCHQRYGYYITNGIGAVKLTESQYNQLKRQLILERL